MEWDNWPIYPCVGCGRKDGCKSSCPAKCCSTESLAFKPEEFKKSTMTGTCQKCGRKVTFQRHA